jgi:CubicO group peptidase (beta-lactamase class C family)
MRLYGIVFLVSSLYLGLATAANNKPPLPPTSAKPAGFSTAGLARINTFFNAEIAANRLPGAVVAIARNGKLVHFKAYGYLNRETGEAMPLNAIFGLASMTKVMASVTALSLNEAGRLPLQARLDQYLPEFGKQKVAVVLPSGEVRLDELARPILIHDLFRHTAGLANRGPSRGGLHAGYPTHHTDNGSDFIRKGASFPLVHQPGTAFEYSVATDILGLVVEKITAMPLGDFMKATIWDKVGMADTSFTVPQHKISRIARPLARDPISGKPQSIPILEKEAKFQCAGGCALGTVGDYLRFGQMLLNGGAIDGARVISPKTVANMTSNHLSQGIQNNVAKGDAFREGYGFGWACRCASRKAPQPFPAALATTPGTEAVARYCGTIRKSDWWWSSALLRRARSAGSTGSRRAHWSMGR